MPVNRGDFVLAHVPYVGATGGKVRPGLVVQADYLNSTLQETIIAVITSNTANAHQPHQLLIDISTADGAATGLLHTSAVRCERLHTIPQTDVRKKIGQLSASLLSQLEDCLKAALEIR